MFITYDKLIPQTVKIDNFLAFVLGNLDSKTIVVAGGAIRDSILGVQYNDVDVFYTSSNRNDVQLIHEFCRKYDCKLTRSCGGVMDEFTCKHDSKTYKIQFIDKGDSVNKLTLDDDVLTLLNGFDLTCNQVAVRCLTNTIICPSYTVIDDIMARRLIPADGFDSKDLYKLINRMMSFQKRNWEITPEYMIKLIQKIGSISTGSTIAKLKNYGFVQDPELMY